MADQFMEGTGSDVLEGSDLAADIDNLLTASLQNPIARLLSKYKQECRISYTSDSSVTISVGEIVLANSLGTAKRMRQNTAAVVLDLTTDLDTGSEAVSTLYYVYAVADADATTFTGVLSTSATFPTGITYARRIASFYNDASGNILQYSVCNDSPCTRDWGSIIELTYDTVYYAYTSGVIQVALDYDGTVKRPGIEILVGDANPPTTTFGVWSDYSTTSNRWGDATRLIPKGKYWKVRNAQSNTEYKVYWTPHD